MTFRPSGPDRPPPAAQVPVKLPRWPRQMVPVLGGLVVVVVLVIIASGITTDYLWYSSVNFTSVFGVIYGTRWALFFVGAILMSVLTGLNAVLAYRFRPAYQPSAPQRPGADAYRMVIDPHRRLLLALLLALIGLFSGIATAGAWRTWLMFINQVPFHQRDAQFHLDVSFFVFTYPFLRLVLAYLFAAVLLSLAVSFGIHWLYGGIGWQGRRPRATVAAQAHLFILLGVFVLLKGAAYWVDRYGIDFSQRGIVKTGASYTDVNAVLPAKTVLAVIAVICALLFFAGAIRRSAMLPAVGFGLLVLSAILIGGLYPAIIQQFVVKPNELAKESHYISREIEATDRAYAIGGAAVTPYAGASTESSATLAGQIHGLPGLRLMDPSVVSQAFQQLQQVKGFYQFPSHLSVDRYVLPGDGPVPQDVEVAVRGLAGAPPGQDNWINDHLVYTHGYGFVAAKAESAGADGTPAFVESGINARARGDLGTFQQRVYFGEQENNYAIVGGPHGQAGEEFDYPFAGGQQNYTYTGDGGVPVGSLFHRFLYAVKFRELNILLSGAINNQSRILYNRQPLQRVEKVAPFLTLDSNPYPIVADHRILWVVDGYTTTGLYPYSQRVGMARATATSQNPGGAVAGLPAGQINYIRNSVKAVVDAYTGKVTLYAWDPADPVLRTWMKAFPGVVQPRSAIPSWLLPHLRYPADLFDVQRQMLAQYHVGNHPQSFYGGQNFWSVPGDPTGPASNPSQPPYYLTLMMPGYRSPQFSLISSFVPRGRANLAAFMAVDSDPTQSGYGTLRLLQLPQDTAIAGPSQVQSAFESFAPASRELTQLRSGGSKVILGNQIMLPVGGGLLYMEPVYVLPAAAAHNTGAYPTLQRVFVYYSGQPQPVGYGPSLASALSQVFAGGPVTTGGGPGGGTPGSVSAAVSAFLKQAQQDYALALAAERSYNLGAYESYISKMDQAIAAAQRAASAPPPAPGATPAPTPGSHH